jgi:uncharacterized protein YbjT (DUF2867 family)
MKVVIFGSTGFVGSNVLRLCISDDAISSIIVVSRRDITPDFKESKKVVVIIHENFLEYPDSLVDQVSGATACFWYTQSA